MVAFGASARVALAAVKQAREKGQKVGLIKPITLWPFPEKVLKKVAKTTDKFLVVEMNKGQMIDDVKLAIDCSREVHFFGRTGGVIPQPEEISAQIDRILGGAE